MPAQDPKRKHGSILIIDDDEAIREMLQLALECEGYRVETADNGKSGLETLEKKEAPCLILLDLMMPVMNGWLFLDALKNDKRFSDLQVVVVTAFSDRAKGLEDRTILKKPIDINFLFDLVKNYCLMKAEQE